MKFYIMASVLSNCLIDVIVDWKTMSIDWGDRRATELELNLYNYLRQLSENDILVHN